MSEVEIVDTSFRDGNASLWGEKMDTAMMFQIAPMMERAGFRALDATAISHFEYAVRYLRENPWERVRLLRQAIPGTPLGLMMSGNSLNIFRYTMGPIMGTWMEKLAEHGIRRVQIMEASNNMADMADTVRYAQNVGIEVAVALVFTHSEVHTDEYYAQRTRDAAALKPDIIYFKDPGGLATPERIRTVIPAIQQNLGGIPLEIHSHCTTGLAPLCYLEAAKLGVKTFHTAAAPLANGPSQPATETFLANAEQLGFSTRVDKGALGAIAGHFRQVAQTEGLPQGQPVEYDGYQFQHQVPGGVISNLKRQLAQLGMDTRLDEVLAETVRVRQELGHPIMVTPFSQFVVTQAAVNVMQGERYKILSDEIIRFALGHYGEQVRPVEPNLLDRITSLPRTKDFLDWERPTTSIDDIRARVGGNLSEEELLLLVLVPEDDLKAMRAAGPIKTEYSAAGRSLAGFIRDLAKRKNTSQISIRRDGFFLELKKTAN